MSHSPLLPSYILPQSLARTQNIFRPWDNVTACEVGDNPESTGSSRPPFAPAFDSAQAVRVGVVVALASISIILAFALLGIGAWFFLRRYRRPRRPDSGVQSESASAEPRGSERESGGRAFMILTLDIENKLYVRARTISLFVFRY
jgi:hypothetical protein